MSNILVTQDKRSNESRSKSSCYFKIDKTNQNICENETSTRTGSVEKGQKNEVRK
jgi:hypothetical protein